MTIKSVVRSVSRTSNKTSIDIQLAVDALSGDVESINLKIGDLSQLPTQAKENLVAAFNELLGEVTVGFSYFHEHMAQIDDDAGLGDTDVTWSADKSIRELADKVDKVSGYSLVDDDEIAKLLTVEQDAQKNTVDSVAGKQGDVLLDKSDVGLSAVDNTSDADKPASTTVAAALLTKFDKTDVVQATGQSAEKVMSQKAVTDLIGDVESVLVAINGEP